MMCQKDREHKRDVRVIMSYSVVVRKEIISILLIIAAGGSCERKTDVYYRTGLHR